MCGIIGYTGENEATQRVVKGLEILEYRGYDSVGICAKSKNHIEILKTKGRVSILEEKLTKSPIEDAYCAIGHTRWATHGAPSDANAHPHNVGQVFLVHNGIIENYRALKEELKEKGYSFLSETDTEVVSALIDLFYKEKKDPYTAISKAEEKIKGSYALAIMFSDRGEEIYAVRKDSPLILGKGEDGYYLASDITALLPFTNEYYSLGVQEIARLTKDEARIKDNKITSWQKTEMSFESAKKGGYDHFMLKEMYEQPSAIKKSLSPRILKGLPDFSSDGITLELLRSIEHIQLVACGSAMHAGIVGARMIEMLSCVPTSIHIASEYRYNPPVAGENTLVIVISQSGETADSIASLRYAKSVGLKTYGIVNAVETTIAREADFRSYTYAGPEVAVATTKGYATQVSLLSLFAIATGLARGKIDVQKAKELTECLFFNAPRSCEDTLNRTGEISRIAEALYKKEDIFYIGRGLDYALSQEGALKLKEISYIHCEAYAAGELKHGTISLIEEGTPVIAIATEEKLFDKTESNIKEVKSRGAYTVLICSEKMKMPAADMVFTLPNSDFISTLFGALMTVQMIAYYVSKLRGCDIDKPRNLAKSVTVE